MLACVCGGRIPTNDIPSGSFPSRGMNQSSTRDVTRASQHQIWNDPMIIRDDTRFQISFCIFKTCWVVVVDSHPGWYYTVARWSDWPLSTIFLGSSSRLEYSRRRDQSSSILTPLAWDYGNGCLLSKSIIIDENGCTTTPIDLSSFTVPPRGY